MFNRNKKREQKNTAELEMQQQVQQSQARLHNQSMQGPQMQGHPMQGQQVQGRPMQGQQVQGHPMQGQQMQGQPSKPQSKMDKLGLKKKTSPQQEQQPQEQKPKKKGFFGSKKKQMTQEESEQLDVVREITNNIRFTCTIRLQDLDKKFLKQNKSLKKLVNKKKLTLIEIEQLFNELTQVIMKEEELNFIVEDSNTTHIYYFKEVMIQPSVRFNIREFIKSELRMFNEVSNADQLFIAMGSQYQDELKVMNIKYGREQEENKNKPKPQAKQKQPKPKKEPRQKKERPMTASEYQQGFEKGYIEAQKIAQQNLRNNGGQPGYGVPNQQNNVQGQQQYQQPR